VHFDIENNNDDDGGEEVKKMMEEGELLHMRTTKL
jgi:hypothetical protein